MRIAAVDVFAVDLTPVAGDFRLSRGRTMRASPRLNGADGFGRRTNTSDTSHSPERVRSIAASSILAETCAASDGVVVSCTSRPMSSAIMRVSPARCSNRRTLMRPVVMTCPDPIDVIRPMGTKTRRLPGISTIRPTTRGAPVARNVTRTSRTLPIRSPTGSNTLRPARRPTKTLELLTPLR